MTRQPFVPVNEPRLDGNERTYLNECIDSGWISSEGPYVARLEEQLAARVGRRHGVAVSSGTGALEIAVAALGLGPGDEVIMPTFTIISCAQAVVRAGATPVLVDLRPDTLAMDAEQVAARVTERTRAIMVVHLYGLPADMDPLLAIAKRHGLKVIEDAAEMHGQTYHGRPCGGFGDISIFSLYANKHVTSGEGGVIVVDDDALAERCRSLRNLCFEPGRRFVHEALGWNYRMTNLQAAIAVAQLERLDQTIAFKRGMGRRYAAAFRGLAALELPPSRCDYADSIFWVYGMVLADFVPFDAAEAMKRLGQRGIGTRPYFWPMHEQPVFRRMGLFDGEQYPVSERLARRGFYLPSGVALTDEQMQRTIGAVRECFAG